MHDSPFQQFLDLVALDQRIESHNKSCVTFEHDLVKLDQQLKQAEQDLIELKKEVTQAGKHVDAQELEMKLLDEAEKEKKSRLDTTSNYKEYQSLTHEIDQLKKKQHALEDVLLQAWNTLEAKKVLLHERQTQAVSEQQAVQEQMVQLNQQLAVCRDQQQELLAQRDTVEKNVPAEWLEKYKLMRARVPDPVVPVVHGSCSACFYKINEQDLLLLKRNKLLQCKDCYRFLYMQAPGNVA